jgi:hypothetical protein
MAEKVADDRTRKLAHFPVRDVTGNGTDEGDEREIADPNRMMEYEAEIANGRRTADQLDHAIGQVERLKAEPMTRFSSALSTQEHCWSIKQHES